MVLVFSLLWSRILYLKLLVWGRNELIPHAVACGRVDRRLWAIFLTHAEPNGAGTDGDDEEGGKARASELGDALGDAAAGEPAAKEEGGDSEGDEEEGEDEDEDEDEDEEDALADLEEESDLGGLGEGQDEEDPGSDTNEKSLGEEEGDGEGPELVEGKRHRKQVRSIYSVPT